MTTKTRTHDFYKVDDKTTTILPHYSLQINKFYYWLKSIHIQQITKVSHIFQVNEIVPEEKCSLRPKQMCHSVTEEPYRQRARRSAQPESPLAFLRRHYLSRRNQQKNGQMLPRRSRNFLETTTTTTTTEKPRQMRQICKMVPEQECEKKRVNPRVVEKQMMKKFCRQPRKSSYVDQLLVARLKGGLKWMRSSRAIRPK